MKRALVAITLGLALVACGSDNGDTAEPGDTTTTTEATTITEATTTTEAPPVTPMPTPDAPNAEQTIAIEQGVSAAYPGVPDGKATDWSEALCLDYMQGMTDDDKLIDRIIVRFAGGDRPDPTTTQAAQILQVIRDSGYCFD